uniref:Uncharacterized protein n=1 Tax=Plectus sambesii TaxID=2011161 RepID=A0A914VC69_9BILA
MGITFCYAPRPQWNAGAGVLFGLSGKRERLEPFTRRQNTDKRQKLCDSISPQNGGIVAGPNRLRHLPLSQRFMSASVRASGRTYPGASVRAACATVAN